MRIAYLSTFYPYRGGIAQFNASLFNELCNISECRAFTFKRQYPKLLFPGKSQIVESDDKTQEVASIPVLDTINPFSYSKSAKEILKFNPDLLLTKFWLPFFAPSLGIVARKLKRHRIKTISILDNVIPHEKRIGDIALVKFFLNQNNGFIVMTEAVKSDLLKLKPEAKFLLHPHPLYDHFGEKLAKKIAREKLKIEQEKKVLLFFGFIRSYKGLDLLLEAMSKLSDEYLLIIAGEVYGSFYEYEQIIKSNNIGTKIRLFTRYISDEEVKLFFNASDVCILPYKTGTQSGIIGISYHFDVPVIATDVGGLAEMIKPFDTGIVVGKPIVENIMSGIHTFFNEESYLKFINNIQKYKRIASWKSLAESICKFYYEL